jgi:hypothetical protein
MRADRNLLASQSVGVSFSVPAFVMGSDDRRDRVREVRPLNDFRAHDRMDFHLFEFIGR